MTFRDDLISSPTLYPIAFDSQADTVCLLPMTQADYAAASFLDRRMLTPEKQGTWMPWAEVQQAASGLPERCHFLFHISHVGSTLLARLLGHHPALFSLREPVLLRSLAEAHLALGQPGCPWSQQEFEERLGIYFGLWSRTFEPEQTTVIKATSFVCEMAEYLLERLAASRALFMFIAPVTFLKALLGGAMSDIESLAEKRLWRLHRRLGAAHWNLAKLSPGERVTMSWLSEMFALHAASLRFPDRVLWMDFDGFLNAPEVELTAALQHLGVAADAEIVRDILAGPDMRQYAKAPEHTYDAHTREQLLKQAEVQHFEEIRRGMEWLRGAAALPPVKQVLQAAASHWKPAS